MKSKSHWGSKFSGNEHAVAAETMDIDVKLFNEQS